MLVTADVDAFLVNLHSVSRSLNTIVIGGKRSSADGMDCPVVASTGRNATALDKELVVRECVPDVVVPASVVVCAGVVKAVLLDVAANAGQ